MHGSVEGHFKTAHELWRSLLEIEMEEAVQEWCSLEKDELPTSTSWGNCSPQKFAELFQMISSLIPHFKIPPAYSYLVLHHPDLALSNMFFDKESLSSDEPKISGVIDWEGAHILPIMLTAQYPGDLLTSFYDDPFTLFDDPDQYWYTVPFDWTSVGDPAQRPQAFRVPDGTPTNFTPIISAMVRRFYLRTYFSTCYAEQLHLLYGDADLAHATLFMDAPYYLKFHETVFGGWKSWVEHESWIRETYWRLRALPGHGTAERLIIGPNIYHHKSSAKLAVRDLGIFEKCTNAPPKL